MPAELVCSSAIEDGNGNNDNTFFFFFLQPFFQVIPPFDNTTIEKNKFRLLDIAPSPRSKFQV